MALFIAAVGILSVMAQTGLLTILMNLVGPKEKESIKQDIYILIMISN